MVMVDCFGEIWINSGIVLFLLKAAKPSFVEFERFRLKNPSPSRECSHFPIWMVESKYIRDNPSLRNLTALLIGFADCPHRPCSRTAYIFQKRFDGVIELITSCRHSSNFDIFGANCLMKLTNIFSWRRQASLHDYSKG